MLLTGNQGITDEGLIMKIRVICGNCGDPVRVLPNEIKGGEITLTLDEDHQCRKAFDFEEVGTCSVEVRDK